MHDLLDADLSGLSRIPSDDQTISSDILGRSRFFIIFSSPSFSLATNRALAAASIDGSVAASAMARCSLAAASLSIPGGQISITEAVLRTSGFGMRPRFHLEPCHAPGRLVQV
jgi:hypothetical protein